ncbi:glycoside hydrolase family 5 protein [Rariglobus hedericola]|uniref:Glycoside hydrolase family 5 protein n=1 Tax=Rariglobus hedericola TaxID=2597822 RepID=A0A556QSD9_9BACT|nr:glycoside hydrolase family 5 protein [Rariglobus hedericola]TSJ79551.1 glycoside hydrolase family 5 protein [Rariglobus hedericola]
MKLLSFTILLTALLAASLSAQTPSSRPEKLTLVKGTALTISPVDWPPVSLGVTQQSEGADHFLRLVVHPPVKIVSLSRTLVVPAGTDALSLSWQQRITGLKPGAQNGDARLAFEFFDANDTKIAATPPFSFYRENSNGWENQTTRIPVPSGARTFRLTPALVRLEGGSYDLGGITVTAVTTATASAASIPAVPDPAAGNTGPTPRASGAPPELRVQGNRLVTVKGGKEVWLQGVNVPSLEWSVKGERILKSIGIATDEWNANVIRLPVKADHWFGKGTKHNTQTDGGAAYRDLVDQAVALASSKGAYLVLDLHHYRAPRPSDLTFWTDAAARYKNNPAVLFDLLNEPHGTTWEIWRDGGFLEEKKKPGDEDTFLTPEEKLHNTRGYVSPGMQKMIDTVRATGAKNIVVIGGLDYAYDLTGIVSGFALKDPNGNGIMYASHVYPWKKSWQKKFLDAAAKHPILLGEVGGDAKKMSFIPANHQEDVATWVPAMLGLIQKHRLNWTGWCFHPSASPRMLSDLNYTPTPFWGQPAKDALAGKKFPEPAKLR